MTIAAWASVSGNAARSKCAMSVGNAGGWPSGYTLVVQLYCPPSVIQRSFLSSMAWIVMGLWTLGSLGAKVDVGSAPKNEMGERSGA